MKRTSAATNRVITDIIKKNSRESIHAFGLQIDVKVLETFFKAPAKQFCQITWVTFFTLWFHEFFQPIFFFCQIIMASPLNSNVPEGRSVHFILSDNCNISTNSPSTYSTLGNLYILSTSTNACPVSTPLYTYKLCFCPYFTH